MKTRRLFNKLILLSSFAAIMLNNELFPQGTDSRRAIENKNKFYIGINITPQQTDILNEGFSSALSVTGGNALNISVDAAYYFSKFIGAGLGAGFSPYSTQIDLAAYNASYDAVDNDTPPEEYSMLISGSSISESQKISFISIPVRLAFRIPAGNKLGFFLNGGVSIEVPVIKTFEGTGVFTYKGYYEQYPVTLENIPEYGFVNNYQTNVSGDLEVNSLNFALNASGGLFVYLGTSFQISLGASFIKSLTGISGYADNQEFLITSVKDQMYSIMGGSTKTGIQALGISLGVRYFLK